MPGKLLVVTLCMLGLVTNPIAEGVVVVSPDTLLAPAIGGLAEEASGRSSKTTIHRVMLWWEIVSDGGKCVCHLTT